jgi:hypothetical protein
MTFSESKKERGCATAVFLAHMSTRLPLGSSASTHEKASLASAKQEKAVMELCAARGQPEANDERQRRYR